MATSMNFGLPMIFVDRKKNPSLSSDSQLLLFPNDIPSHLHKYELVSLSTTNNKPDHYLINYKDKILLKLLTIKYKDAATSAFVHDYVIQIKHLIVACKYDFLNIILKIIFSVGGDPFSFVSSKIKSYYTKQQNPNNSKIGSLVMNLWELNFSNVQYRIKQYTLEHNLNNRILLQPNNTILYNNLAALKHRISQHFTSNKYHFTDYSSIEDVKYQPKDNSVPLIYNNLNNTFNDAVNSVNQCTKAIDVIHNKIVSVNESKLDIFSWIIVFSLFNEMNFDNIIPGDLLKKIKDFNIETIKPQPIAPKDNKNINKRLSTVTKGSGKKHKNMAKDQTSITHYFKALS